MAGTRGHPSFCSVCWEWSPYAHRFPSPEPGHAGAGGPRVAAPVTRRPPPTGANTRLSALTPYSAAVRPLHKLFPGLWGMGEVLPVGKTDSLGDPVLRCLAPFTAVLRLGSCRDLISHLSTRLRADRGAVILCSPANVQPRRVNNGDCKGRQVHSCEGLLMQGPACGVTEAPCHPPGVQARCSRFSGPHDQILRNFREICKPLSGSRKDKTWFEGCLGVFISPL